MVKYLARRSTPIYVSEMFLLSLMVALSIILSIRIKVVSN